MTVDLAQVAENFSRAAERYDTLAVHQNGWMQRGLAWALEMFPQEAVILDIGCGTGSFAEEAKKRRPSWHITGLDIAPGMLAVAAARCNAVIEAGAESIPCPDDSYNAVFSSLALQWTNDKQRAFDEIARVLKPQGTSIIITLGERNLVELSAIAKEVGIEMLDMETADTYAATARKAGFRVISQASEEVRITYPSAREFLNSMRDIGAGNAQKSHDKQAARQKIARLVETYEKRYGCREGVYATWQPVFLALKKL